MKKLIIILLCLPLTAFTIGDGHYFDVKEGNEKYKQGNYDEALTLYERARARKESDVSKYNLGNGYFRKGDYDSAAENFVAMLDSKNRPLAKQGLSNFAASNLMGGFAKAEKGDNEKALTNLKTAASAYKKILLGDPVDKSAKENLELALNKIKELEKENQKSQDKKEKKDNKQDKQDESKQKDDGENQDDKKDQAKGDKGKKEQKQHESADKKQKGKMSEEEVDRILKALAQDEEKLQKSLRRNRTKNYGVEKDW